VNAILDNTDALSHGSDLLLSAILNLSLRSR
jgi:hypothetical protein